jgi:choline monooxygenase
MDCSDLKVEPRLSSAATIPSRFYTEPEVLTRENDRVFGNSWQLVGHASQVAQTGRYFTASVADEPVLIARGEDRLRGLSNVCRHRAGPVAAGEGTCRAFRCGYHGWSYGLDGALLNTPEFDGVEHFEKKDHGLPEFRIEEWLGMLFLHLGTPSQTLAGELEDLPGKLRDRGLESMRLTHRKEWEVGCNWKVYVDNYLEGYHIPIVHPGLMKEIDYARYETETRQIYSIQHSPIKKTAEDKLRAGAGGEAMFFWIYPNLMLNVYPDNFSTNLIVPLSHDRTLTLFEWYFRDPENPATRRLVDETVAFSDEIQREDIAICEAVQRGLKSRTYDRGRYSVRRENGVHHFHRLYAAAMS